MQGMTHDTRRFASLAALTLAVGTLCALRAAAQSATGDPKATEQWTPVPPMIAPKSPTPLESLESAAAATRASMPERRCRPPRIAGCIGHGDGLIVGQRSLRNLVAGGKWPMRNALKVGERRIAPPLRFQLLDR